MSEKNENVKIQVASVEDAEELLAIYAPYVEKTAITFEYEVPSVEEFKGRIAHVLQRFPYLKAVEDGKILGYAYVSPFKERAAYGWSVETSIYVDENVKHKGVGRKLHEVLEACDYYFEKTGRRITFEYSLVHGVNDTPEDAKELMGILKDRNCHLNLIPVNPIKERNYEKPDKKSAENFKNKLEKNGINVTIRREMGSDIDGACGQLRRKTMQGV